MAYSTPISDNSRHLPLLEATDLQAQANGAVDSQHQDIIIKNLQQESTSPEDRIRYAILTDNPQALISELIGLKPQDLDAANLAYTHNYHSLLAADAMSVLPEQCRFGVARLLTQNLSQEEIDAIAQEHTTVSQDS